MRFKNVWTQARIVKITDVAANVRLFELEPETGIRPYSAGAHIDVTVLINGLPEIRSYSLVGAYVPAGDIASASSGCRLAVAVLPTCGRWPLAHA